LGWYAGHLGRIRGFHALVNQLNDETFPAIALPIPTTGPLAGLGDLRIDAAFCKSAWACVAVGDFRSNVNDYGFVVQEIGGQWAAPQLAPLPPAVSPATADWYLTSVACLTTDTCIAVGVDTPSGGGPSPLVDVLSSTGWRATQPPTVPSPFTPASVSCSSANWCVAVGSVAHATSDFDTTSLPAFAWGTEQRLVAGEVIHHFTGEPRFTNATALWGIDCTSGVCTAVGSASEVGPHIVAFEDPIAGAVRR
jgi:hypothetical protein